MSLDTRETVATFIFSLLAIASMVRGLKNSGPDSKNSLCSSMIAPITFTMVVRRWFMAFSSQRACSNLPFT